MKKAAFLLPLLLALLGSAPGEVRALGICTQIGSGSIEIRTPYGSFSGNSSIVVPRGTSFNFSVGVNAEPSSVNGISYPGGSANYRAPSDNRSYTTSAINDDSAISVWVVQNCAICYSVGGEPICDDAEPPETDVTLSINVQQPAQVGTVRVNSNINQGNWSISGPDSFSGSGTSANYAGARTGSYSISAGSVSGYNVSVNDSSQSLSAGGTITFSLTYTPSGGGGGDDDDPPSGPVCGNGIREGSEQCDTGGLRGACPASCSNSCTNNDCFVANYCASVRNQSKPVATPATLPFSASVTMNNCGNFTWAPTQFLLGSQNSPDMLWGLNRIAVSSPVPAGHDYTFAFTPTAPASLGMKNWAWRMVQEGVRWFGDTASGQIDVTPGPPSGLTAALSETGCTTDPNYSATFSWSGEPEPGVGFWVDISTVPNFATYSNKRVPSGTTTNSSGFSGGLVLQPDVTYYVRVFNGVGHSPTVNFTLPYCRRNACGVSGAWPICTNIIDRGSNECATAANCPPPSPVCSINANPPRIVIPPTSTVNVAWSCEGPPPINCTLSGFGAVPSIGQRTLTPTSTLPITLNCIGPGGTTTESIVIRTFDMSSGTLKEINPQ